MPDNTAAILADQHYVRVIEERLKAANLPFEVTVNRGRVFAHDAGQATGALVVAIEDKVKAANLPFEVTVNRPDAPRATADLDLTGPLRVDGPLPPETVDHVEVMTPEARAAAAEQGVTRSDAPLAPGQVSHVDINPRITLSDLTPSPKSRARKVENPESPSPAG